ncbi:lipopolysaccharide assembly protein LapA domain-containing protein [Methylocapsa sp. S129]|uniref:lipopolysaccharide assembly protein LapA domain-containing protein n=1 Tax=Methylocapsa sp. S129 TaxID=1641869 RepID=UPI00131A890C|nr:LapA family protein [Methylocapsa sp. S129]
MKNLLKFIVLAPIAILLLIFAFANRHIVTVSFDPFVEGDIAAFAISAPLFLILILAMMIGVMAGGAATWLAQGKYRKAARQNRAEAERLRGEAQRLRPPTGDNRVVPNVGLQHHA